MATFTWTPEREPVERLEQQVLVTRFESGKEQRRKKSPMRRVFELEFIRDEAVGDEIWQFYLDREGPLESFSWEHPTTGETITVRFSGNMERAHFLSTYGDNGQTFEVELVEVL